MPWSWTKRRSIAAREIRSSVLGKEFVDNAFATADDFNRPLQELVTEYCWGAIWGREELPKKTRSMLNLAMISALNRPHELKAHIKGALVNGVTPVEIREILLQVAIYCGVPAAVDSFRIAREAFAELKDKAPKVKPTRRNRGSDERTEETPHVDRREVGRSRLGRMVRVGESVHRRALGADSARRQGRCRPRRRRRQVRILRRRMAQTHSHCARRVAATGWPI